MADNEQPAAKPDDTKTKAARRPVRKQKYTEKELKALGLDPACYGYVKN